MVWATLRRVGEPSGAPTPRELDARGRRAGRDATAQLGAQREESPGLAVSSRQGTSDFIPAGLPAHIIDWSTDSVLVPKELPVRWLPLACMVPPLPNHCFRVLCRYCYWPDEWHKNLRQ